jgi:asparagine synthase (glutamine-hydrolysing)
MQEFPATKPDRDEPPPIVYRALFDQTLKMAHAEGRRTLLLAERGDEISDAPYDHLTLLRSGQWQVLTEELEAQRRLTGQSLIRAARALLYRPLLANLWSIGRLPRLRRFVRRLRGRPQNPLTLPPWVQPDFAARVGLKDLILEEFTRPSPEGFDGARGLHHSVIFSPISIRRLQWIERCHARFGVSFADPWSDRRIAEFVLAVPQWVVSRVSENKRMARQAMRGFTPEAVRKTTRKTNPQTHYDLGFRERARETILDLVAESEAARLGYMDSKALLECYQLYCDKKRSPYDFWWGLSLEMWLR